MRASAHADSISYASFVAAAAAALKCLNEFPDRICDVLIFVGARADLSERS